MEAAFIPEVNNELDTQNFEKFEEVRKLLYLFSLVAEVLFSILFFLSHLGLFSLLTLIMLEGSKS